MKTRSRSMAAFAVLLLAYMTVGATASLAQNPKSNNPQTEPYEVFFSFGIGSSSLGGQSFVLPIGKRFVVEHVTAYVFAPSGQKPIQFTVSIRPTAGGASFSHQLIPVFLGIDPGTPGQPDRYAVSQLVKWYSVSDVGVLVERNAESGNMTIHGTITGYLTTD